MHVSEDLVTHHALSLYLWKGFGSIMQAGYLNTLVCIFRMLRANYLTLIRRLSNIILPFTENTQSA